MRESSFSFRGFTSKITNAMAGSSFLEGLRLSSLTLDRIRFSQSLGSSGKFNWKVREKFYQHLADQVGNEIPINTALNNFRARMLRAKKTSTAALILLIAQKLKNGDSFAESLEGLVSN